jgi:hypothetical protein
MIEKLVEIILPERMTDLKRCCNEVGLKVKKCYGIGKDYCPKTCTYAKSKKD